MNNYEIYLSLTAMAVAWIAVGYALRWALEKSR